MDLFLNLVTDIKETASAVNFTLMKLISLQNSDATIKDHAEVRPNGKSGNNSVTFLVILMWEFVSDFEDGIPQEIDLQSVVDVLIQYLLHNSIQTKVAVLQWIHHLYTKLPSKVCAFLPSMSRIKMYLLLFPDGQLHRPPFPCVAKDSIRWGWSSGSAVFDCDCWSDFRTNIPKPWD